MPNNSEPLHAAPKRVGMNAEDFSSASWSLKLSVCASTDRVCCLATSSNETGSIFENTGGMMWLNCRGRASPWRRVEIQHRERVSSHWTRLDRVLQLALIGWPIGGRNRAPSVKEMTEGGDIPPWTTPGMDNPSEYVEARHPLSRKCGLARPHADGRATEVGTAPGLQPLLGMYSL
jgi:hypothetical protein